MPWEILGITIIKIWLMFKKVLDFVVLFSISLVSSRSLITIIVWASLVAQWLRICLPMQGTQVRALVWEDPTCRGATRPVSHNY